MKNTNLIDIMNKLVHLAKPCVCILVLEVCSHGPHNMICPSNVSLEKKITKVNILLIIFQKGQTPLLLFF